jgi:hypothetical protein
MQYIRTRDQALAAVAGVLEIADRPEQLVQSVVRIMLCLEAEAREFLVDCQALLVEGGLDARRRRRRDALAAAGEPDLAEDRALEDVAGSLDALRFSGVVRQVFPSLRAERWIVARALLAREDEVRAAVAAAVRARGSADAASPAAALAGLLDSVRPSWIARAADLLAACRAALGSAEPPEAAALFELAALDDAGALAALEAADRSPAEAAALLRRLQDLADAARDLPLGSGAPPGSREVA